MVSLFLALLAVGRICQVTLIIASVLYAAWFSYLYMGSFYLDPTPQSGLILLFVGLNSLPVMLTLWVVTLVLMPSGKYRNSKGEEVETWKETEEQPPPSRCRNQGGGTTAR